MSRLNELLHQAGSIGRNEDGSITRVGFSREYFQALEFFKGKMEELGMRSPYAYRFLERDSRRFDEKRLTEALLGLSDMNIKLRQGGRGYEKLEEILVRLLA